MKNLEGIYYSILKLLFDMYSIYPYTHTQNYINLIECSHIWVMWGGKVFKLIRTKFQKPSNLNIDNAEETRKAEH